MNPADARAPWQEFAASGGTPSSWLVRDQLVAADANGLIDPSRQRPGLWHLVLFRWNTPGTPTARVSGGRPAVGELVEAYAGEFDAERAPKLVDPRMILARSAALRFHDAARRANSARSVGSQAVVVSASLAAAGGWAGSSTRRAAGGVRGARRERRSARRRPGRRSAQPRRVDPLPVPRPRRVRRRREPDLWQLQTFEGSSGEASRAERRLPTTLSCACPSVLTAAFGDRLRVHRVPFPETESAFLRRSRRFRRSAVARPPGPDHAGLTASTTPTIAWEIASSSSSLTPSVPAARFCM